MHCSRWSSTSRARPLLVALHRADEVSRRRASIPGGGPIAAMVIPSMVPNSAMFRSGREFTAWLGLTPRSHSSGGKDKLGRISKRGDRYICHLLYVGAGNAIRFDKARAATGGAWIRGLQARRPPKVAIIALANKMAANAVPRAAKASAEIHPQHQHSRRRRRQPPRRFFSSQSSTIRFVDIRSSACFSVHNSDGVPHYERSVR